MRKQGQSAPSQDWDNVVWTKNDKTGAAARDKKAVNQAARAGAVDTERKQFTPGNKKGDIGQRAAALDRDTESTKHERVGHDFKMALQQARLAKKMTQAQLAQAINEKGTVINEYESGRAIPDGQIIQKLNRALGCRLPKAKA